MFTTLPDIPEVHYIDTNVRLSKPTFSGALTSILYVFSYLLSWTYEQTVMSLPFRHRNVAIYESRNSSLCNIIAARFIRFSTFRMFSQYLSSSAPNYVLSTN